MTVTQFVKSYKQPKLGFVPLDLFNLEVYNSNNDNKLDRAKYLLSNIKGADDESIINAIKLVGYDQCYRAGGSKSSRKSNYS